MNVKHTNTQTHKHTNTQFILKDDAKLIAVLLLGVRLLLKIVYTLLIILAAFIISALIAGAVLRLFNQ